MHGGTNFVEGEKCPNVLGSDRIESTRPQVEDDVLGFWRCSRQRCRRRTRHFSDAQSYTLKTSSVIIAYRKCMHV